MPLHHVACDYPIAAPFGSGVRIVITQNGVAQVLLDWVLAPRNRRKSRSWQRGEAQAFGLFYDFFVQRGHVYRAETPPNQLLSDFAEALLHGTIQPNGTDETGLFWPKLSFEVADAHIKRLTRLSDYCVDKSGDQEINPWVTADWSERLAQFRKWDASNKNSLLRHLGDRKDAWERAGQTRTVSLGYKPKTETLRPPYFPPSKFADLIKDGFVIRGAGTDTQPQTRFHRKCKAAAVQGA